MVPTAEKEGRDESMCGVVCVVCMVCGVVCVVCMVCVVWYPCVCVV